MLLIMAKQGKQGLRMAGAEDRQATQWQNSTRSAGGQAAERTAFQNYLALRLKWQMMAQFVVSTQ